MILGMTIALAVLGLYMLFTGRSMGKNSLPHWQFRLLGGFLLTLFPLMFIVAVIMGIIWGIQHPGGTEAQAKADLEWPLIGVQSVIVAFYGVSGFFWEKSIKRKALAAAATPTTAAPTAFAASPRPTGF